MIEMIRLNPQVGGRHRRSTGKGHYVTAALLTFGAYLVGFSTYASVVMAR